MRIIKKKKGNGFIFLVLSESKDDGITYGECIYLNREWWGRIRRTIQITDEYKTLFEA